MVGPNFIDTHLKSPIIGVVFEYLRERVARDEEIPYLNGYRTSPHDKSAVAMESCCKRLSAALKDLIPGERFSVPDFMPEHYAGVFNFPLPMRDDVCQQIARAHVSATPLVMAHMQSLANAAGLHSIRDEIDPYSREVVKLSSRESYWADAVRAQHDASARGSHEVVVTTRPGFFCLTTAHVVFFALGQDKRSRFYATYQQLLMIRDCILHRRNALMAAAIVYPEATDLPASIIRSYEWQEKSITIYGNEGYGIAKQTESLSKTYVSRLGNDILSGDGDAFDKMLEKVRDKERDLIRARGGATNNVDYMADQYHRGVLQRITRIHDCIEVFGTQKLCGHPVIDIKAGAAKVQATAKLPDQTMPQDARRIQLTFRRLFIESYIRKEHRWPRLIFTRTGTRLEDLYNEQRLLLHRRSVDLEDYSAIRFCKEFRFDGFESYLKLLDDKAISLKRSEANRTWDSERATTESKLILEILSRETYSLDDFIQHLRDGTLSFDYFIESMFPKECEFKPFGRMFGLDFFEPREFFAAHEANLADQILPYFPQITMSDSKLNIHQRFLDLTNPRLSPDVLRLMIELDLSEWNTRWRALTVEAVGRDLNDLFDAPGVFTFVHRFFAASLMLMRIPGARPLGIELPEPPQSDLCWTGHLGGMEGRTQKLWSLLTVCMIECSIEDMNLAYDLTDQGDNIAPVFFIPRDWSLAARTQLKQVEADVIARCEVGSRRVNQIVKGDECTVSSIFLSYSKVCYVDGADYPTTIKSLMKTKPAAALDFPSFSSELRSIFAGAYAAAETARRPERCYWYALHQGALLLLAESGKTGLYARALQLAGLSKSSSRIRFALICPPSLGGFPVIGPYAFMYRGGGDPVSKEIAGLKMIQDSSREARQALSILEKSELFDQSPTIERLIMDPYSFPIAKPRSPENAVAEETLNTLRSITRNRDFRDLLDHATDTNRAALIEVISKMHPFNPVIASDLFDCSAFGTLKTVQEMFLRTGTIQRIARQEEESTIIQQALNAAEGEILFQSRLARTVSKSESRILSVHFAVNTARRRWAKSGVIPEGITSYLPIDFDVYVNPRNPYPGVILELQPSAGDLMYERGRADPFFGSATREKRSEHGYKIVGSGPANSALRSLQSILAWSDRTPETTAFIDYLSRSRAGINLSEYLPLLMGILGGDAGHRYQERGKGHGAYLLGYTTFASHCILSSDRAGFLSASVDDYKVMFQEIYLYLISVAGFRWDHLRDSGIFRLSLRIGDRPLEQLMLGELNIPYPNPLEEVPLGMKFAQAETVFIERMSGYVNGHPFIPGRTDESWVKEAAVVSEVFSHLQRSTTLTSSVSRVKIRFSDAFGLQEIRGLGVLNFVRLACVAIFDHLSQEIPSPRNPVIRHSSLATIVSSYADFVVSTLLRYWEHPELQTDRFVLRCQLYHGPSYSGRAPREGLLRGIITGVLEKLVQNPDSILFTLPVVVFGSDRGEATFNAYRRLLRRTMHRAVLRGEISIDDANFVIGSTIKRTRASQGANEIEDLTAFNAVLRTYGTYKRGRNLVSERAKELAEHVAFSTEGYRVHVSTKAASEVIRDYRYVMPVIAEPDADLNLAAPPEVIRSFSVSSTVVDSSIVTRSRMQLYNLLCSMSRPYSLGSGAASTWLPLRELFRGGVVLIIGSGEGACAASALIAGAKYVRAHDLRDDYPYGVMHSEYRPPLVRLYRARGSFAQTEETLSTSGDWYQIGVAESLLRSSPPVSVIVIDIPGELGRQPSVLEPLCRTAYRGAVLIRAKGGAREHALLAGAISAHGKILGMWERNRYLGISERVVAFVIRKRKWTLFSRAMQIETDYAFPVSEELTTHRHLISDLLSALCIPIRGSISTCCLAAIETMKMALASSGARLAYEQFSMMLEATCCADMLLDDDQPAFVVRYCEAIKAGFFTISRINNRRVIAGPRLLTMLTRKAARLVGGLDVVVA